MSNLSMSPRPAMCSRAAPSRKRTAGWTSESKRRTACPAKELPPPPRRFGQFLRPAHDVILKILVRHGLLGRAHAAPYRDTGGMNGFGVARDQRVPPVEVPALG